MSSLGAPSFDSLSVFTVGLSDQCASINLPLGNTAVHTYQFGEVSSVTSKGLRAEWWRIWFPTAVLSSAAIYFAINWWGTAAEATAVVAADLTPDATKKQFGLQLVFSQPVLVMVPRDKPFAAYRWSGPEETILYACRVWPPSVSPGP